MPADSSDSPAAFKQPANHRPRYPCSRDPDASGGNGSDSLVHWNVRAMCAAGSTI